MTDGHKPSLIVALGVKPKGKMAKDDMDDAPLKAAAKDLITAVKSGDVQGVMDALEAASMHCMMKHQDSDETEPEENDEE